ncbi:hypothetical protein V1523DRAFT_395413 [Lipomyces doorenjongii]
MDMPKLVANANSAIWCWRNFPDPGSTSGTKSGLGPENFEKFIAALFGRSPCLPYSKRLTTGDYVRESCSSPSILSLQMPGADALRFLICVKYTIIAGLHSSMNTNNQKHALSLAKTSGTTLPVTEIAAKVLASRQRGDGHKRRHYVDLWCPSRCRWLVSHLLKRSIGGRV